MYVIFIKFIRILFVDVVYNKFFMNFFFWEGELCGVNFFEKCFKDGDSW